MGQMVIIDVETGEYGVDATSLETARRLHAKRPDATLFGTWIGYDVADALGGVRERTASWRVLLFRVFLFFRIVLPKNHVDRP
jgi:hypothetical protein